MLHCNIQATLYVQVQNPLFIFGMYRAFTCHLLRWGVCTSVTLNSEQRGSPVAKSGIPGLIGIIKVELNSWWSLWQASTYPHVMSNRYCGRHLLSQGFSVKWWYACLWYREQATNFFSSLYTLHLLSLSLVVFYHWQITLAWNQRTPNLCMRKSFRARSILLRKENIRNATNWSVVFQVWWIFHISSNEMLLINTCGVSSILRGNISFMYQHVHFSPHLRLTTNAYKYALKIHNTRFKL